MAIAMLATYPTIHPAIPETRAFWRRLFAPEVIFTAATMAALAPYVLWYMGYKLPIVDRLELTYIPVAIWVAGLVSFLLGSRIARRTFTGRGAFRLQRGGIPTTLLLSLGVAAILAQVYLAIQDVYGVLPLLDYLSSSGIDIGLANDQQQYSASGQIGLLTTTLYALNSIIIIAVLERVTWGRGSRVFLGVTFIAATFAHLINAKRGGLYSSLLFLLIALSIYFGDPIGALAALVPRKSRLVTKISMVATAIALIFAFGYIASIRTRGKVEASTGEIISYLQYPLINFEGQCRAAGFGPGEYNLFGPLRHLTPYKYGELIDTLVVKTPRFIMDSPSGIYELIHWCWGITGVVAFSLFLGFISRWFYDRALQSLACLLSYSYLAIALAMAHTSNHVLILSYLPAPLIFVLILKPLVLTEPARYRVTHSTESVRLESVPALR
jgi:oligosaccharide repeat unit polymerase